MREMRGRDKQENTRTMSERGILTHISMIRK